MTREQWKQKYDSDPAFRLERLHILRKRHFKRVGGPFARDNAYDLEIRLAREALARQEAPK